MFATGLGAVCRQVLETDTRKRRSVTDSVDAGRGRAFREFEATPLSRPRTPGVIP